MTRTIITCPGIGDTIWLFMKLVNQPEKFHWKIGSGQPQRGKAIFDLFPQLVESFEYIDNAGYKKVKRNAYAGKWANAPEHFYLEANSWLEDGRRIEGFLRDLGTTFKLEYKTSEEDIKIACGLLYDFKVTEISLMPNGEHELGYNVNIGKYIGIYSSAYSNARHWGGWELNEWLGLINMIKEATQDYKFVFLGASYDIGISEKIMDQLSPEDYINTIGQPLSVVCEILKRLDAFLAFPSGLSIMNETCGAKKTLMMYPKHLSNLMNAWPDQERIENNQYKGCLFTEPEKIFNWMKEYWKDLF